MKSKLKMLLSFLFIFVLINFINKVEAKNSCNDDCLTKTYCISSDGSSVCSNNNLVTAQFKVIPVFGDYDYLQITLKGYNVAPDDEKTIKVSIDRPNYSSNVYTCYKSSIGTTNAKYTRASTNRNSGSSYYMDGVLYCNWIFNYYDAIWPQFNLENVDMIKESSQSIILYHGSQKVQVAEDTSQLPIYKAQHLKCCNKVHGNDAFSLTFDRIGKQIRYQIYYLRSFNTKLNLVLTRKDGIKLQFECYIDSSLTGWINNGSKQVYIYDQLIDPTNVRKEIYSWATPFILGDSRLTIDASTSVFDLQVQVDKVLVYTEKGVELKNSSYLFKSSAILISFTVLFQIALIYYN